MKSNKKKSTILIKIFSVILALTISLIFFILAVSGIFVNKPNPLYAHIHLAITLILLIAVVSLVASFVIRKILKPLSILNEAVEKAAEGKFDQKINIKSNDEFGSLADAFNKMTTELKKMIKAREQLLLDVSHELRTPVTRARLALEMMPDSHEKKSVEGDLKEMETMITGILESERLENGSIKPDLKTIRVTDFLQKFHEKYNVDDNRLKLFPISEKFHITIDENLIMTVLRNVIDNALKYSSEKPVEISVINKENNVIIQIDDNGSGIPENKLPFIFEPFYRADQSRSRKTGGYGLGLHLCKKIMDLHNAEILVQNKTERSGLVVSLIFKDY